MLKKKENLIAFILMCGLHLCIALLTNGTGDAGDGVNHFLYSKYAFKHPELFLDLWNKPVFTLLSAPFAQLGFTGIKIFNALCGIISAWLLMKTTGHFKKHSAFLIPVLFCSSVFYLVIQNSSLTEPLFSLGIVCAFLFLTTNKYGWFAFVISLLPFVRQEGYILLFIAFAFLLLNKQYKQLLLLAAGHLLVTLAGLAYHKDVLWVFKNNTNTHNGHYGHGNWTDYIHKLAYVFGKPFYFFIALGFVFLLVAFFRSKNKSVFIKDPLLFPFITFLAIVMAHTVFWRFGLFKSMGMERNLISIFGCGVFIAFYSISSGIDLFAKQTLRISASILSVLALLLYPFSPNPKNPSVKNDFSLLPEQKMTNKACEKIEQTNSRVPVFYSGPQVCYRLNLDPFDSLQCRSLYRFGGSSNNKFSFFVVWDNWLSVVEHGVSEEALRQDRGLRLIYADSTQTKKILLFEHRE